jgi:hypothetical protein
MVVSGILRDDDKKFNSGYSFGELNQISIMNGNKCIFFKAPGVELGPSRAPTVFYVPALVIMKKSAMRF